MADKQVFIADGHHRYEVARIFRDEMRMRSGGRPGSRPYDYAMMYFAPLNKAGLTILATHRVIKDIGALTAEGIIKSIEKYFEVTEFRSFNKMRLAQEGLSEKFAFGMYCGGNVYYLLKLKNIAVAEKIIKENKSKEWKRLDVTLLHSLILGHILRIKEKKDNIIYLKDASAGVEKVKNGSGKLVFLLSPTKLEQMKNIARLGEKMPHKSTYFYPKLLSGVVINKFDI